MRGFFRSKPAIRTSNHYELTIATTGGTELQTPVFTCTDAPGNRGLAIPEGAILKRVIAKLWSTDNTVPTGKHQCLMLKRPGATVFTTGPVANWFLTTDPATEEMIDVRRYATHPPETRYIVTGATEPLRYTCSWKGNWSMRDGDDMVVSLLDASSTNWTVTAYASWIA